MRDAPLVRTEIRIRLPKMLRESEELANVDSGSYPPSGVARVARRIGEHPAKVGFELSEAAKGGDRLYAARTHDGLGADDMKSGRIAALADAEDTKRYRNS